MRTRLGKRTVVLGLDAVFGVVLLITAVAGASGGPVSAPSSPGSGSGTAELAARLGNVTPPGQSTGFAVAADGSLGLVDRGRQVLVRLDGNAQPLAEWGPTFATGVEARDMLGLAPDGDGWAVLDRGAQRILRLDAQGRLRPEGTIDLEPLATYGPNGLASDGHGNLYLADTGRDRIVVFESSGRMSASIGEPGTELGKFRQPMFVAFASDGAMLVSDWENARIERFDAARKPTNVWPVPAHAWGVAVDPLGRVYVPDADHRMVRMFGQDGSLLAQFGDVESGGAPLPVDTPSQVAVSPDGSKLWILGVDGLARVDLSAYAGVRPSRAVQLPRTALAMLGAALLALSAGAAAWPYRRRLVPPRRAAPPVDTGLSEVARVRPRGLVLADLALPTGVAVVAGLGLTALGLVGAILAMTAVAAPAAKLDPWPRMAALGVTGLIFAVGSGISARALPWRWVADWPLCRSTLIQPRAGRVALSGAAVSTLLALVAGGTWWFARFQTPEATRGAILWLAAIVIVVAATAWSARLASPNVTLLSLLPWLLFLVALVPRAWDNANLPYGVWFDEAEAGLQARRFLQEGRYTPITDTYGRDASLVYYFIGVGQLLVHDPVLAARLVSALIGAACAPLIYFMGRELFGWRVGLVAAVLLAALRWHLDVSRLGWDPISLPLCAILAIWLLARAVRTERWTDAVWAGLAVGLGLHGYIASRALPIVGLGMLVYAAWWLRWRPSFAARHVGLVLAAAVLAGLPVLIFAVQEPAGFNGRLNQTLILNEPVTQAQKLDEIWSNLQKHVLMFHVSGDLNGRHNLPGLPMLDVISGVLAVLGLGVLLSRPFDWRSIVLVGWGVACMLGGILTFPFEAPQGMRTLGVTPVLVTLVAVALVLIADRVLVVLRSHAAGYAVSGLAGIVALVIAWINLTTFFGPQMNDPTVWEAFSTRETIPSRALLEAGRPIEAVLGSPTIAPSLQQQLLVPDRQRLIRTFDASTDLPYRGSGPALLILETEHEAGLAEEVARYYPDATRRPIVPPNGNRPTVEEFILEPAVLANHRGLRFDGTAWRGLLALDTPGLYAFRSPVGGPVAVDGSAVSASDRLQLARGNHIVEVRATEPLLEWQSPISPQGWVPVDPNALYVAPSNGNGLEVTVYPSRDFQGSPTDVLIDPVLAHYYHTNPLARLNVPSGLWSMEWRGTLEAPSTGAYRFEAERLSRAGLWIDDRVVFDETTADGPPSGQLQLTAGAHRIRVRLQQRGDGGPRLYLYWTPPSAPRELIPGRVLFPPPPQRVPW